MNGLMTDIRFGLKLLASRPGFTAAAVLTLALGIGANTAVFSVLNGYLLKPLPYPHGGQLVRVDESEPKSGLTFGNMSIPIYEGIRQHVPAFANVGLYNSESFHVESNGQAALVKGETVTPSVFDVLGVKPLLGETFSSTATEQARGHKLVLSYRFWQRHFGGAADIIGKHVRIAGKVYSVLGVMPESFAFPDRSVKMWAPMTITAADRAMKNIYHFSPDLIARFRDGANVAIANRQLRAVWGKLGPEPEKEAQNGRVTFTITPWRDRMLGDKTTTALLLQAAVLFLLLITCVNVANLLLSRILGRTHEMAMRAALGASRWRLARQLLIEGLCLALSGGIAGVALGWLGLRFFAHSAVGPGSAVFNVAPDWRVACFAVVVVALTGIVVSLLPLWHVSRTDLHGLLQEGSRMSGGRGARRVRRALAVTELGLATVLLVGAGLLLHSLMRIEAVNPGYQMDNVLIAGLSVPSNEYTTKPARRVFYRQVRQRIEDLPGVEKAGMSDVVPFSHHYPITDVHVHGSKSRNISMYVDTVNNAFMQSLQIPLLRGRGFNGRDTAKSQSVVIINRKLAKAAFPHGKAMGREIYAAGGWRTVVGIVPTVKMYSLTDPVDRGTAYVPLSQGDAMREMRLAIKTTVPPASITSAVQRAVQAVDPLAVLYRAEPLRNRARGTLNRRQATMNLVLIFGGIALALAFVGVYGVLSYAVRQRTNECGIRLALGAEPRDLLWLILRDGLILLVFGLGIGLTLAVALGYVARSRLFAVVPFDPVTLIGVAIVLSGATMLACWLPARRAAKIDPAAAMTDQ
jgi:predicted permease